MAVQTTILKCLLLCVAAVSVAQEGTPKGGEIVQKPCTPVGNDRFEQDEMLRLAEEESDTLRSWDALESFYRRYRGCVTVSAIEGYDESIARILVDHWETLPRLAQLSADNPEFANSVRLGESTLPSDIAAIRDNALHHCPAGLDALCSQLWREALGASLLDPRLQVALQARRAFGKLVRNRIVPLLIIGAIVVAVWFFGKARSDEDGESRVKTSIFLRFLAGFIQLMALWTFLDDKRHFVFVAKSRLLWGNCAGLILVSGVVLMAWAVLWAVRMHFFDSSHEPDILDASESTAIAAARISHVADLQTNMSGIWFAGFIIVFIWLGLIARG